MLIRRIDELFMAHPFLGSRPMVAMLRADGHAINRKRVQRLMRTMGLAALGPKPRTSGVAPLWILLANWLGFRLATP